MLGKKQKALEAEKAKLNAGLHQAQKDQIAIEREYSAIKAMQSRLETQQQDMNEYREQLVKDRKSLSLLQQMVKHEDEMVGSRLSHYRQGTGTLSSPRDDHPYPHTADRVALRIKEQVDLYEKKCWEMEHEGEQIQQDINRVQQLRNMKREENSFQVLHPTKNHKQLSYELKRHADELYSDIRSSMNVPGADKQKMMMLATQIQEISAKIEDMHQNVNEDYASLSRLASELDQIFVNTADIKSKLEEKEGELDKKSRTIATQQRKLDEERLGMAKTRAQISDEQNAVSQALGSYKGSQDTGLNESLPGTSPGFRHGQEKKIGSSPDAREMLNTSAESHNAMLQRMVADEERDDHTAVRQNQYLSGLRQ